LGPPPACRAFTWLKGAFIHTRWRKAPFIHLTERFDDLVVSATALRACTSAAEHDQRRAHAAFRS
ncbi:hypothetical protein, partial [Lentzea sp. NPDC004782]|uniref:hypothetical protein n=1 Tax=Lentzea sp. NPDC004782 TaxID=3154458 RepID=UPI0033AAE74F